MNENQKIMVDNEMLSAYLDRALTDAEVRAVEAHLATSKEAQDLLADFVRIRDLFGQWEPKKPDAWLIDRISERIGEETALAQGHGFSWRRAVQRFALAAMLLFAAGALAFLNHRLHNQVELVTLEAYLSGALDNDVREVTTVSETDLSKDFVLDIVLTNNIR